MSREKVSEWWEVWICVPHRPPVRRQRYGHAVDARVPHEGYPTREQALWEVRGNSLAKIVHVVRYRTAGPKGSADR